MNILIIDDHPLTCQGLAALLSSMPAAPQVHSSHSASKAREQLQQLPAPDWIFLDINLPDDPQHQLFKFLCDTQWIDRTVLISAEPTHHLIGQALSAGARGFIPKTAGAELVIEGFAKILEGDFYLPSDLLHRFTHEQRSAQAQTHPHASSGKSPRLSPRLLQVQALLLRGSPNKIIARELNLSLHTVKQYVSSVLTYHGVSSRLDLVLRHSSSGVDD